MRRTVLLASFLLPWMFSALVVDVEAQTCGAAPSTTIDPSARSLGMGGASSAVFWGGDPNDWANPALLGYHHGIRYGFNEYRLAPDLASNVFFTSTRITMGGWGVGVSFAGQPNHLGGARLDYGTAVWTDSQGDLIGIFSPYETIESFGVGVNVVELAESVLGLAGRESSFGRWGDLSLGWARKEVVADLFGGAVVPIPATEPGRAETNDLGFVLRVRPIDTVAYEGWGPQLESLGGLQIDAVFAMSSRNHDDAGIDLLGLGDLDFLSRDDRYGLAIHVATGLPAGWHDDFETHNLAWLALGLAPFLSGGVTWEHAKESVPGTGDERLDCAKADLYGAEVIVANILSLRWGYVDAPDSAIDEATWGVGLGFSLGGFLGVRYDHASSPQASGLADRGDQGVTAYVDGMALARFLRGE